jgi:glycosyltransferase involved in cell wall biosynthesis
VEQYSDTAVVIPTTFSRVHLLEQTLTSVIGLNVGQIIIVVPKTIEITLIHEFLVTSITQLNTINIIVINQNGFGAANAINVGLKNIDIGIEFVTWIGDDDFILKNALITGVEFLRTHRDFVATFGFCKYIDKNENYLWTNSFGSFILTLASFGPNLIPQPGAMFRFSSLQSLNFLDESYSNSFDHDLYLRLKLNGKLKHFPESFGIFRWHSESLSVKNRKNLCYESAKVRIKNQSTLLLKFLQLLLEPFIFLIVFFAPIFVIRKRKTP